MSYREYVIKVNDLGKRYEIYASPRDRLKQLVLSPIMRFIRPQRFRVGGALERYPQFFREFWALRGVSFEVKRGDTVGVLGVNGSGKSTLLQLICSTLSATDGSVEVNGRLSALLELGSGFNPEYTGRENVFLNGQLLGLTRQEIDSRFEEIESFADIGDFIDEPVKLYSSGMLVRLAFSVAINVDPEILIVDEALAVGDIAFQRKCLRWMEEFTDRGGVLLFVSHSTEQIRRLCNKALYLKSGKPIYFGDAKTACDQYERDVYARADEPHHDHNSELNLDRAISQNKENEKRNAIPRMPECAVEYGSGEVRITEAWLEDVHGSIRNIFQQGEKFRWCYRVKFDAYVDRPVFGFLVKTKEGLVLHGTNTSIENVQVAPFKAGDSVVVEFLIQSNLGAGEYFLNCGVSIEGEESIEFLHRIVDAGVVKILTERPERGGLVSMSVAPHLSVDALTAQERTENF